MGKITTFDVWKFLKIEEEYLDMMSEIESRAAEIAKDFGVIDDSWDTHEVWLSSDAQNVYVHAVFKKIGDSDSDSINYQFNSDRLFSDSYKSHLGCDDIRQQIKNNREYLEHIEYLRLKEKFEGGGSAIESAIAGSKRFLRAQGYLDKETNECRLRIFDTDAHQDASE